MIRERARRAIAILVSAAAVAVGAGCATPSPTMSDYQTKSRTTARAMAGVIGVARTGAQQRTSHRLTSARTAPGRPSTPTTAGKPPTQGVIALRRKMDQPLQDASSTLSDLRIALRRNDRQSVRKAIHDLAKPLKALNGFTGRDRGGVDAQVDDHHALEHHRPPESGRPSDRDGAGQGGYGVT